LHISLHSSHLNGSVLYGKGKFQAYNRAAHAASFNEPFCTILQTDESTPVTEIKYRIYIQHSNKAKNLEASVIIAICNGGGEGSEKAAAAIS
jgi:hypothetical protein